MLFLFNHEWLFRQIRDRLAPLFIFLAAQAAYSAPLDPPAPGQLAEAKKIVQEMIDNPRGPYSRIRWYCNDGTVLPPQPYACREHGGGRQHGEYSPQRQRLAEMGWSVGTIFAALSYAELFDAGHRNQRLRQLALERYLIDIDDGWVLRRARHYRGRVQLEDEDAAGRKLLVNLMSDAAWVTENYLLVREAVRSIPHGEDTDLVRSVRRKATQLALLDSAADKWRAEIHSDPSADTAGRLRQWSQTRQPGELRALAIELAGELDTLYGAVGRQDRIAAALQAVGDSVAARQFRIAIGKALTMTGRDRINAMCAALSAARTDYLAALEAPRRLALVDAMQDLETEVQLAYSDPGAATELTRFDALQLSASLLHCTFSSGLISATELASITSRLDIIDADTLTLDDYRAIVNRLKRTPGWAMGSVRHTFAEALMRYSALDSRAARFSDDLLRGSPMWPLGEVLKTLSRDLDQLSGSVVQIAGKPAAGAVALNSGVARGTLRIFETIDALEHGMADRRDIVVIPETIAELSPVAGILTLGEGNALSHVQLLARNFGIPNLAVDYGAIELLAPLRGQRVLMIVTEAGDVLIEPDADPPASATQTRAAGGVSVPVPDLGIRDVLILDDIDRSLSGRVVGPKAANLGQLNRLFPGRVAPAVALPFGVYSAHLDAAGLTQRIRTAFAGWQSQALDEAQFAAQLAEVRRDIAALELSEAVRAQLVATMREQFGEPGSYGVFVRSDTNVEDLPQFTGAGLNETIPNLVDFDAQLKAIPRVWSSVLSPRALAWRSTVLENPEQIYASVLLMKSVAADKSGVLVTRNLFNREAPGLTASTAWGVGGAVAGEAAETIVIGKDDVEVISEAKSPYRRNISAKGGVDWLPARAGRVLNDDEVRELRRLAAEVNRKYTAVLDEAGRPKPWDIEFGFVDGALTLFQIRPLAERGAQDADKLLRQHRPGAGKSVPGNTRVHLNMPPQK